MTGLLVSVRNAAEAVDALAGGATIIDVKEPTRGALGASDPETIRSVVRAVDGHRPVTAALGEMRDCRSRPELDAGVSLVKLGLSGTNDNRIDWPLATDLLIDWHQGLDWFGRLVQSTTNARLAAVAYADWERAKSPPPYDVFEAAINFRMPAFLIDTWGKDGTTLLDWIDLSVLADVCRRGRAGGLMIALAGSVGRDQIIQLLPCRPDLVAVRGAACAGGDRTGAIDRTRVAALVELISQQPPM